jgi:hypothetical protein
MIRKVVNRKAPYLPIGNARNERSCIGKSLEVQECLTHLGRESVGYLAAPFPVPGSGFAQLATSTSA